MLLCNQIRAKEKIDESHQTLFRVREGLGRDYRNVYTVYVRVPGTTGKPLHVTYNRTLARALVCYLKGLGGHQIA